MGGCTSLNKNAVHPQTQAPILNSRWRINQNKEISSGDKLLMHNIDGLHSEVKNVVEEFEYLRDYFNSRLETILEANYIFNQFYSKLKLLKKISKEKSTQQLEKILEIVHRSNQQLPKIEGKLASVKEKLRYEQVLQENPQTKQRKYMMLYRLDEMHFEDFQNEIIEWDSILKKYVNITYEDIKSRKRMSNDSGFQPSSSIVQRPYKMTLLNQSNRMSNTLLNSQVVQTTQNQTQSTLNQSQNCL